MHRGGRILLLPNAWDVASARVFEEAGFGAIATTSAGIAFTLGYPDGQRISRQEMLAVVRRIAAAVKVPVTADVEAGYGDRPEDAAHTARAVAEAGAVGMNLEDATGDPRRPLFDLTLQVERVKAVREAMREAMVLNARTDVICWDWKLPKIVMTQRSGGWPRTGTRARTACLCRPARRGNYRKAGQGLACPVNILVGPGSPSVPELEKLGVARVSVGSGAMRATLGLVRRIAEELKNAGSYKALEGAISYDDLNRMME